MHKNKNSTRVEETVKRGINFEVTLEEMSRRSERRAWWVASAAMVATVVLAGGYIFVIPLKEKTPFLVMADAYTGTSTVSRLADDRTLGQITTSEAVNRSHIARYVMARESYDEAIMRMRDWKTVFVMSSPGVASAYRAIYADSNPDSPYVVYGKERALRVRILSIVLHSSATNKAPTGATVRFQRSVYAKSSGTSVLLDGKIATLTYSYKPGLKMDERDRVENPLGFQVSNYRIDDDFGESVKPGESHAIEETTS
ncbi:MULTISPECIES: virB8 family protein [Dyella]|uniref:Type IV secretion system protein n=2 Tax=Dyella TaxID=231454 RepID=A0A4R0YHP4_9GAMM|nr:MULTISPECIES: type IV secretion system protein [Dyella]TBR36969.1 type IV secretion system protein [Dyella terrae]TCI07940.1 type IV secretion system protein [Dyella soli]